MPTTFTAGATRHALASIAVELTDWVLGTTYLGPAYDLPLPGGGSLTAAGVRNRTIALTGGGSTSVVGRNPHHRLLLSGGGEPAANGEALGGLRAVARRVVVASVSADINTIELGSGPLGPQPFGLSGGGDLSFGESVLSGLGATFALSGGGDFSGIVGVHRARGFLLDGGGGALAGLGSPYVALFVTCAELLIESGIVTLGPPAAPPAAGLVLTLVDDTLDESPATVVAIVGNGTPGGIATFEISDGTSSVEVLIGQFDDSGAIGGISVPVDVIAAGTYGLVVTDVTQALTATAPFTVAAINTAATIGVPVTTPPTPVQTTIGVKKWVFQDPATSEVYTFPINPSKMNSPHAPKRITFAATTALDGVKLAFEGQSAPVDWKFEGVLFEKTQYDAFVHWLSKRNRLWVTDHWGRAWLVYLTGFEPVPRRSTAHQWCHDYTFSAIIFEGPVTPA